MKTSIARREFLLRATRGFGLFALQGVLIDGLMARILNEAFAQSSGVIDPAQDVFYVHISFPGGPPRWYFDLPLTPMGKTASNFVPGKFGTAIVKGGGKADALYQTASFNVSGKTMHLPPVWGMNLSQQKFSNLLPNTLFIRGVDMEINNHQLSNRRQISPVIGGFSLSGAVADQSSRPLPGLLDQGAPISGAFRSAKGLSGNDLAYTENATTNPVSLILAPFLEYRKTRPHHNDSSTRLGEQALAEFEKYAENRGISSSALTKMYDAALELTDKNINRLSSDWASTVAKYRGIVNEAIHPAKGSLPGVFDASVPGNSGSHPLLKYDRTGKFTQLGDLRDMINGSTTLPKMAENFAITELLLGEVTSTASLSMPPMQGLQSGAGSFNMTHDQHDIGAAVSIIASTLFYRALLGCLTSFTSHLKSKGLFDKTLIQISSEFNRTPKADGSGSDHGYMGSAVTLISGRLARGAVIGNIQKASYSADYQGTFGVAAPFSLSKETRRLRVNDVARSVSALLGIADVTTNGESLLVPSGSLWVPRNEEARNV